MQRLFAKVERLVLRRVLDSTTTAQVEDENVKLEEVPLVQVVMVGTLHLALLDCCQLFPGDPVQVVDVQQAMRVVLVDVAVGVLQPLEIVLKDGEL